MPLYLDYYWHQIFSMIDAFDGQKYTLLSKLVKAALTLLHDNAHIDRGFGSQKDFFCQTEPPCQKES